MTKLMCIALILFASLAHAAGDNQRGIDALNQGDLKKAYQMFMALAKQGDAQAQSNVGAMYSHGMGVPKNEKQAVYWFEKSAKQGNNNGQFNLGTAYYKGNGVSKNYKKALVLFNKAARQGNAQAQSNVGLMYTLGEGTLQNYQQGYMWLNLARYNGVYPKKPMDILISKMSPESIEKAQHMSKICLESHYKNCGA